jgi:ubiquinone/menaquinone biosynthesis C-methylase UbiE
VIAALLGLAAGDRVLDLGCGHGRHARLLAGRVGSLVGLDRSGEYLRRAISTPTPTSTSSPTSTSTPIAPPAPIYLRADLRALPLRPASFDAAYSWYASLFMFSDAENEACLAAAARALRPGARLLVHHANPLRLAVTPHEISRRALPGGGRVEEESRFDAARGVDRCARRLVRPDGTLLEGTAELRYYTPSEWGPLAHRAGLRVVDVTSTTGAGQVPRRPPGAEAPDLIALLEKT